MTEAKHGLARIPTIVAYDLLSFEGFLVFAPGHSEKLVHHMKVRFHTYHRMSSLAAAPMVGLRFLVNSLAVYCTVFALS